MSAKRPFKLPNYPQYDPATEGFGSPRQWKSAFHERMGLDEAKEYLHDDSPFGILQLAESPRPTWNAVRSSYRKLMRLHHPDLQPMDKREAATETCKRINAAYVVLENLYGK